MSDPSQDTLLREIDEDIRRERYAKLWKRHGAYVIGFAVLLVVVVAGHQIWQQRTLARQRAAGQQFAQAMTLARSDRAAAERAFSEVIDSGPAGYAMLATFERAALLLRGGDRQGARALYQELQRSASEKLLREFAIVLDALAALEADQAPLDADAIRARLQPLIADTNPLRFTARELTAILDLASGNRADARSQLSALAADLQAPADIRARARQVLAQIGEG